MIKPDTDVLDRETASAVSTYCMGAIIADMAARDGFVEYAKSVEGALTKLLAELPREQQREALSLAFQASLAGDAPSRPRLRLVHSRD